MWGRRKHTMHAVPYYTSGVPALPLAVVGWIEGVREYPSDTGAACLSPGGAWYPGGN